MTANKRVNLYELNKSELNKSISTKVSSRRVKGVEHSRNKIVSSEIIILIINGNSSKGGMNETDTNFFSRLFHTILTSA